MDILTARIIRTIKKLPDINKANITMGSDFMDDLGMDSFHRIELMALLEIEFKIIIPDSDGALFHSVEETVHYISNRVS